MNVKSIITGIFSIVVKKSHSPDSSTTKIEREILKGQQRLGIYVGGKRPEDGF